MSHEDAIGRAGDTDPKCSGCPRVDPAGGGDGGEGHADAGNRSGASRIHGAACDMAVGDMGGLVGDDRLQLRSGLDLCDQARMDKDMAAVDKKMIENMKNRARLVGAID